MIRTAALGSAATLITGTLAASLLLAPSATAATAGRDGGGAAEAIGVQIAAARAARTGIEWKDCPADWGFEKPIQCGWVKVPLDYTKPFGKTIELAVDRIGSTGTKEERQGALVYNPGGPGGSGMRFPRRVTTKSPLWVNTSKAYDFVGFDPAASATPRRSPASTRRSSSRPPRPTRSRPTRPTSAPSASSPPSTRTAARSAAARCCRT